MAAKGRIRRGCRSPWDVCNWEKGGYAGGVDLRGTFVTGKRWIRQGASTSVERFWLGNGGYHGGVDRRGMFVAEKGWIRRGGGRLPPWDVCGWEMVDTTGVSTSVGRLWLGKGLIRRDTQGLSTSVGRLWLGKW